MLSLLLCTSFSCLCQYSKWLRSSESVPLLLSGASFIFIIPSAFVTLSASALTELTPRRRLRIIAAGPFHNILLWCILLTVKQMGLGSVIWTIGYRNLGPIGRIVVRVDHVSNDLQTTILYFWLPIQNSPLRAHLPPGTIITKLDDIFLGSRNSSVDIWTSYLTGSSNQQEKNLGWCVEALGNSMERSLWHPWQLCSQPTRNYVAQTKSFQAYLVLHQLTIPHTEVAWIPYLS